MKAKRGTYIVEQHYEAVETTVKNLRAATGEFAWGLQAVMKGHNETAPVDIYTMMRHIRLNEIQSGKVTLLTPVKVGFEFKPAEATV